MVLVQAGHAAGERLRPAGLGREPVRRVARERARRVRAVALHQHAELVAAEPARERAGEALRGGGERLPGRGQRAVAGVVALAVVDVLQAVEVAEQQRQLAPVARQRATASSRRSSSARRFGSAVSGSW